MRVCDVLGAARLQSPVLNAGAIQRHSREDAAPLRVSLDFVFMNKP